MHTTTLTLLALPLALARSPKYPLRQLARPLARPLAHLPLGRPWIIRGDGLVDQHVEQGANEITLREPNRPLRPLHPRPRWRRRCLA